MKSIATPSVLTTATTTTKQVFIRNGEIVPQQYFCDSERHGVFIERGDVVLQVTTSKKGLKLAVFEVMFNGKLKDMSAVSFYDVYGEMDESMREWLMTVDRNDTMYPAEFVDQAAYDSWERIQWGIADRRRERKEAIIKSFTPFLVDLKKASATACGDLLIDVGTIAISAGSVLPELSKDNLERRFDMRLRKACGKVLCSLGEHIKTVTAIV